MKPILCKHDRRAKTRSGTSCQPPAVRASVGVKCMAELEAAERPLDNGMGHIGTGSTPERQSRSAVPRGNSCGEFGRC
jgi:hypothetical protein